MKKTIKIIIFSILLMLLALVPALAVVPYRTYNYTNEGFIQETPHAYITKAIYEADAFEDITMSSPGDVFVAPDHSVYISDAGSNRIICLDKDYKLVKTIDGFTSNDEPQTFSQPKGLFVNEKGDIYIADTGSSRVVALDSSGNLIRLIEKPETEMITDDYVFAPVAVTVDRFSRVFVIDRQIELGIIAYDENNNFTGFIGSQAVSYNALEYFWKRFFTDEQKSRMQDFIPTVYNNLACDKDGFIYGVTDNFDSKDLKKTIDGKIKDGKTTPIKKLNHKGFDILVRNGFYPPVGDIFYDYDQTGAPQLSTIVDVAIGESDTYSMLDSRRGRVFTYSKSGVLLFAFGEKSTQFGNNDIACAIDYNGSDILVLDSSLSCLTVYERTSYGELIIGAQADYNAYRFDESAQKWEEILALNPNYALAYEGIGQARLNTGNYHVAMDCFKRSGNIEQYSEAFKGIRNEFINKYLALIIIAVIVIIVGLVKLFGFIGKCNREKYKNAKHPLFYHFTYGFYILFHPFDGFWDLKHEKRGSIKVAHSFYVSLFIVEMLRGIMTSHIASGNNSFDFFQTLLKTIGISVLFVIANWCLTSLMDGKGDLKSIYTAVGYSLLPMILLRAAIIPLSYIITFDELMYITFIITLSMIWTLFLIFAGVMVTQQYTLAKNVATLFLSVAGMAIIVFILLLFLTTFYKIRDFIKVLVIEFTR